MMGSEKGIRDRMVGVFFKQKAAYEISACLVGSGMCIRDRPCPASDSP